ncbi:MAG: HipA family kinase [Blastocatellia bacterium]
MRTICVTRYVTPLREGGSLPAIVEADDDGLYVLKFRGAGQGTKALIAELIAGETARALGLLVPEIVFAQLDLDLSRTEPDPEIQDLLKASAGLNLALDYLPGSITFDPLVEKTDPRLASEIVWLDAFVKNVDRTARNTNMLMWHKRLWLIDHGAALYFHHNWQNYEDHISRPFAYIKDHVLLRGASELEAVTADFTRLLSEEKLESIVALIPDEWLAGDRNFKSIVEHRRAYTEFLKGRLEFGRVFVEEAESARKMLV